MWTGMMFAQWRWLKLRFSLSCYLCWLLLLSPFVALVLDCSSRQSTNIESNIMLSLDTNLMRLFLPWTSRAHNSHKVSWRLGRTSWRTITFNLYVLFKLAARLAFILQPERWTFLDSCTGGSRLFQNRSMELSCQPFACTVNDGEQ